MRKQRTSDYIQLGTNLRFIIDVPRGTPIHGGGYIIDNINETLNLLDALGLTVTMRLFFQLDLEVLRDELHESPEDATLTDVQEAELQYRARQLRETAIAESSGLFAYVTSEKRLDVNKLLDEPASLFPAGVFADLSEMAQTDVTEGFKCIAFERATAAAFHLMRAVEESLRCFYVATVKQGRVKPLMWWAMTDHLGKRKNPPASTLLAQLDHIRSAFRNPTQHPDAVYDVDGAQDLAFLSIDVLTRLVRAMPSK